MRAAAQVAPSDLEACRAAIRAGSLSFHAASRLLPAAVRDPALVLYAFCRLADDAVDHAAAPTGAVLRLSDRLEAVYAGRPANAPADRAFAAVVEATEMPRALPEALLEGLAWDADGRRYETLSELLDYAARVAASVGAMMCVLMGVRDASALARACDLGLAMQLTNVARDVGEDAGMGRIYLPRAWLAEAGVDPHRLVAEPAASPALTSVVSRLLREAERLYARSEPGIGALPVAAQPGIWAARSIYAGIGREVLRAGCDPTRRARTTAGFKMARLTLAYARPLAVWTGPMDAPPAPEVAFLVEAAARRNPWGEGRAGALVGLLAQLEARDREMRGQLRMQGP
jgi:phytoene synthase